MVVKFDIENFPKSETAKRMMSRVSPIYENSYVGKWLFEVMGTEWDTARTLVESLRKQCFVEHCTWGMHYFEQEYGIELDETKDIETRRRNVFRKKNIKTPCIPSRIEALLKKMLKREVTICEQNELYAFVVEIGGGDKINIIEVISFLNIIKPSHLSFSLKISNNKSSDIYCGTVLYEIKNITLIQIE